MTALGSVGYKEVLFSTSSQPGWKDARWLGAYLVNSALVPGCAELLALSVLGGHVRAAVTLRNTLMFLLVLNVIPGALLFANLRAARAGIDRRWRFRSSLALDFVGGTLIPLTLLLVGDRTLVMLVAVSLILLGSLAIHYRIKIPHASHGQM